MRAALLRRDRGVGHHRRMLDQAFDAAEALGQREQLGALEEALGAGEVAVELDRDHAAEAVHLRAWRARAADGWRGRDRSRARTSGAALQPARDLQRVLRNGAPCAAPASSGRAGPGSCRTGRRSRRWRSAGSSAGRRRSALSPTTTHAADHVGMAVEILGGRMHDDVEAELQRPLDAGAGEGVVGDRRCRPLRLASAATRLEIDQRAAADWSASRPRSSCVSGRIAASTAARSVRSTKVTSRPGRALAHPLEQPEGAAIEVVGGDDMGAGVEQFEHGGDRRQARGEGEARGAALQVGDRALEGEARRVLAAASTRSPCARRGSAGRRSRWRRSAPSPRRSSGRALAAMDGAGREGQAVLAVADVGHRCAPQMVDQVDAGDQAEEFVAVEDDGHLVARRRSAAARRAAGSACSVCSLAVMAVRTGCVEALRRPSSAPSTAARMSLSSMMPTSLPSSSTGSCETSASAHAAIGGEQRVVRADGHGAALAVRAGDQVAQVAMLLALGEALVGQPEVVEHLGQVLVAAVADEGDHALRRRSARGSSAAPRPAACPTTSRRGCLPSTAGRAPSACSRCRGSNRPSAPATGRSSAA